MITLITSTEAILIFIGLAFLALLVFTLRHIRTRDLPANIKILWIMVVLFLSPVGMVLYYLIGANQPKAST